MTGIAEILNVITVLMAGQRKQGLRGLGELGIEQLVNLVVGIEITEDQRTQPGNGDAAQQQRQQALAQRKPDCRHLGTM